ncbi:MAG: translesion error-prone DNA polymerase V autoproteolytic subunit [Myxococcaceae bacterium]
MQTLILKPKENPVVLELPLFSTRIAAGFPSPADDFLDKTLDLNEHLIHHPASTFFIRVVGDSMINVGIFEGDLLIVDKSLEAKNGSIVVAIIQGEFTVKKLVLKGDKIFLVPENPNHQSVEIRDAMHFEVWGVVTNVIHSL